MNSFSNMELAIEAEIQSQIDFYRKHPNQRIKTGTYRFDLEKQKTILMRSKESAEDYRYFPEPDLPPLVLDKSFIKEIKTNLKELPSIKKARFINELGLSEYFADLLIADKPLCDFFESGVKRCINPKAFCNWVVVEFAARANELNIHVRDLGVSSQSISDLVGMIESGKITGKMAKEIADLMIKNPNLSIQELVDSDVKFRPMGDLVVLEAMIDEIIKNNPESVTDYKNGKDKAFQFLVGQVMKKTQGSALPSIVKEMFTKKIT
jgi:aspartyl-tRNA(Asn)/glutamyl-tRNA(Gln) amidotransferase subunit B